MYCRSRLISLIGACVPLSGSSVARLPCEIAEKQSCSSYARQPARKDPGHGAVNCSLRIGSGGGSGGRRGEERARLDLELLAGDVAGGVGGQVEHRLADVGRVEGV